MRGENARVAQDLEHALRQSGRTFQSETKLLQLRGNVHNVTHHGDQQLVDTDDDLAIHERLRRRVSELDLDAAILLQHLQIEVRILLENRPRIIADGA